jgi:hypothetical protein
LDAGEHASLDELVEALILGSSGGAAKPTPAATHDAIDRLVLRPPDDATAPLVDAVEPAGQLQFLTNRFGPLKLATRILANLAHDGSWPELSHFQTQAAVAARRVGQRLRAEDQEQGRGGAARRWVAYPVGKDERAAGERYAFSFTLFDGEAGATGPLAQLGLAAIADGRAALTERGWTLAAMRSPTLDGSEGSTLSVDEVGILRRAVLDLPEEAAAIAEFLRAVRLAAGRQGRVDELLGTWHAEWTADRAAAERSAMLGRLGELGVLRVDGRGPSAQIELMDSDEFERDREKGQGL